MTSVRRIQLNYFQLGQKTLAMDTTTVFQVMKVDKAIKNIVSHFTLICRNVFFLEYPDVSHKYMRNELSL